MFDILQVPPTNPTSGLPSSEDRVESLSELDVREDNSERRAAVPDLQESGSTIRNLSDSQQLGAVRRFIGSQNTIITQLGTQLDLAREINAGTIFDTAFIDELLADSPFSAEDALITDSQNSLLPTVSELLENVVTPQEFLLNNQSFLLPADQDSRIPFTTQPEDGFAFRSAETVIQNAGSGFSAEFEILGLEPNLNLAQARESANVLSSSDALRTSGGSLLPPPADLISDFLEL